VILSFFWHFLCSWYPERIQKKLMEILGVKNREQEKSK